MAVLYGGYSVDDWDQLCLSGKKPGRRCLPNKVREHVYKKFNRLCQRCGERSRDMQIDHRLPLTLGGGNESSNLWLLCGLCNTKKGNRWVDPGDQG